ncbi:hypothetical protein Dalk_1223 [Desulfatibacillum aliphaticivorans]|uniref:Uncharacterized protein n=1 Tax=Desulfatibacillum aliphaticivorans TaxID=218208 RepID=B8F9I0_DESAL|nr:hypothetical protein [Desulfatibacillum aliphaticivorans]ACL02926.1 hypothetical protein Dalk_1223 [Desulfatibacillum aliphaticivorans]
MKDVSNPIQYKLLAWIYATIPNDNYPDGLKAIEYAKKAIALEGGVLMAIFLKPHCRALV